MTEAEVQEFDSMLKAKGISSRAFFFKTVALQYLRQFRLGEDPEWPPRFVKHPRRSKEKREKGWTDI